ncbi:MAG: hypothetical protein ACI9NG_002204 [Hyphomonas sp.]
MQPLILARSHLAYHPEKELSLLLKARSFRLRDDAARLGKFDEFVDAGLIIGELRLPPLRPYLLRSLRNLQGKVDQGCGNNNDANDLRNKGSLFKGRLRISGMFYNTLKCRSADRYGKPGKSRRRLTFAPLNVRFWRVPAPPIYSRECL